MRKRYPTHGFTLLELSIVLVVIGLIVGGVLVGRDLIIAAQNRAQISQIEKLTIAVNTFKVKHNGLPGDLTNAAALGVGTAGGPGVSGNGDSMLAYTSTTQPGYAGNVGVVASQPRSRESLDFWYNLAGAGLWPDNSAAGSAFTGYNGQTNMSTIGISESAFAKSEFNNSIIIPTYMGWIAYADPKYSQFQNGFWIHQHTATYPTGIIPAPSAFAIDSKADDGLPYTGKIRIGETPALYFVSVCNTGCGTNQYSNNDGTLVQLTFLNRF